MRIATLLKFSRPKYLWKNKRGHCTVCGKPTLFLLTGPNETIRNHAICVRCGSCSRHRHIALWVLNEFKERGISRLADFRGRPEIAVWNAAAEGPVVKALGAGRNITYSEYFDGLSPGETRNGVQHQDLQKSSFADETFDLIISEDVFEHVPDYRSGFREVHRVLKQGGLHIFSIPFYFDRKTRDLFELKNGKPVLFEPIEYHGDPNRGQIPCYVHFGYDTLDFLRDLGFATRAEFSWHAEEARLGTFDCYTFITRKT